MVLPPVLVVHAMTVLFGCADSTTGPLMIISFGACANIKRAARQAVAAMSSSFPVLLCSFVIRNSPRFLLNGMLQIALAVVHWPWYVRRQKARSTYPRQKSYEQSGLRAFPA